eukprot:7054414-Alexandrium_andersonii.AAC.1
MKGMWTRHRIKHVHTMVGEQCPWCGAQTEDVTHLLWQCARFQPERESKGLGEGHAEGMPAALRDASAFPVMVVS